MKVTSFSTQSSPMTSLDFGTVLTTVFVIVDDWYAKQVKNTTIAYLAKLVQVQDQQHELFLALLHG